MVDPDNLKEYLEKHKDNKKIVISQVVHKHLVVHKEGKPFDKADYYAHPKNYKSKFAEYLPYIHFLVNGIYWENKFPRVLSIDDVREAKL